MSKRKAQPLDQIPNSAGLAADAANWDAAVGYALRSLAGSRLVGRRFADWRFLVLDPALPGTIDNTLIVTPEPAEEFEFGFSEIEDFAYWLDDAIWLDDFPNQPALQIQDCEHLLQLLRSVGDVGEIERYRNPGPKRPPGLVRTGPLLLALSVLRRAWRIAQAIQKQDLEAVADILRSRHRAPGSVDLPTHHVLDDARGWLVGTLLLFDFYPSITDIEDPLRHFVPGNRPTFPLQLVMLAIAVGAGAVDAPLPALQICDYKPCGRTFAANRSGSRGSHCFCSPRCGKRFHATKHTYAKRAAARAAKQNPKEQ